MTTYFNFQPSNVAPFSFNPVLDGAVYNATVPWVYFSQRYFLNLVAADGTPIIFTALGPGSPTGVAIQSISWADGFAQVTTLTPHGYRVGSIVSLTLVGCSPSAYNGLFQCLITGPLSFSYALASNPGVATVFGNANYDINLLGGVPDENGNQFTSTLVFRAQSQQFEVNP